MNTVRLSFLHKEHFLRSTTEMKIEDILASINFSLFIEFCGNFRFFFDFTSKTKSREIESAGSIDLSILTNL